MRRAVVLGAVLAIVLAPTARAAILDPEDAAELANALAEATYEQKVCYGWSFEVSDDDTGQEDGPEVGSNFGPGTPVDPTRPECAKGTAVLQGGISYTSQTSEYEDSASWAIESTLPDQPTIGQLEALGYTTDDLLGDANDLAIINATGALPGLVAERGIAPPVPFETSAREPGVGGEPTNSPGSDFLREKGSALTICAVVLVGGLVWFVFPAGAARSRRNRTSTRTTRS